MSTKKSKVKNRSKKIFAALALGMLAISGLAINISAIDSNDKVNESSYRGVKEIRNNPLGFIKTERFALPSNFDYIEQMNKEFAGDFSDNQIYSPGDSLKALQEKENNKEK
jgi:hypothetical protein